jgi:hypothetical protein
MSIQKITPYRSAQQPGHDDFAHLSAGAVLRRSAGAITAVVALVIVPLAPWTGFAVTCAWAAAALGLAVYVLRRRDA